MDLRLAAAVTAGRAAGFVSKRAGRGGGTAVPGVVAERLHPGLVGGLGRQLGRGRVLVTGTNGKTTTTRILASILDAAAIPYIHNREGSNLMRGIGSTLLARARPDGRIPGGNRMLGLFEVDEATLPAAAGALAPSVLAFTNLFRDQLDRYGEVDTVFAMWREALGRTPREATLVLNADDPSVADLAPIWPGPVHWFGLDDAAFASGDSGAFDARWCRTCGGSFTYDRRYFAHVGWWRCTGCGRRREPPSTAAVRAVLGDTSAEVELEDGERLSLPLTGVYNVYNALAAVATARVLGIDAGAVARGVAGATAAFGRQEEVLLEGRRLRVLLCKNPAGANQVLRLLASLAPPAGLDIAVLLNDRFADGQDVSWVWDVDFELLAGRVHRCWAGGDRAEDIALRLEYAGWPGRQAVAHGPGVLLDAIVAGTAAGETVYIMPTYTAMLDLRRELAARGAAGQFWERS